MKTFKHFSLYLIADPKLCRNNLSFHETIAEAIQGGVDIVQLRAKALTKKQFLQLAQTIKPLLKKNHIPFIINDHVDIAKIIDADGVHIGQTDMTCQTARDILGPQKIIGLSIENLPQAYTAANYPINYLGIGPIFPTSTKNDAAKPLERDELQKIVNFSKHNTYAIGGITTENFTEIIATGINGIAVASAICDVENPQKICQEFKTKMDRYESHATKI